MNTNTPLPSIVTVPFHGANLFVVERDGEPYVPMRPIVEGMGMAWQTQHRKLEGSRFAVCVTEMVTQMPGDDQKRAVTCLPLRKLPGWLMSIHPNKVRAELRERIVQYQNECDDVLWRYWNEGHAVNPRATGADATPAPYLTPDQQATLQALVHARVEALAPAVRAGAAVRCWMALKRHFGCTYKRIPGAQFAAAVGLIARLPLAWEAGGREALPAPRFDADDARALQVLCGHVRHVRQAWHVLEPALRALRSPVAAELHSHIVDGIALAGQFERRFRGEFEAAAARNAHAAAQVGPGARDPETAAWLRQIDAVVPGKRDMGFIRDAAQGHVREPHQQTSSLATVLAELLASARTGRLVGLAAFASYRDTTYDVIVSHDTAWDPLRTLGGIAELQEEAQRLAARARRD